MFASGFLPGALIALVVESALTLVFALVCFADQIPAVMASLRLQLSVTESGGAELPLLPNDGRPEITTFFLTSIQKSFGYFVFLFFMAYVIAALVEESIKWGVVRCKCPFRCCIPVFARVTPGVTHPFSIVVYVLAGGLGFSTVENIFYTCSSHIVIPDLTVEEKNYRLHGAGTLCRARSLHLCWTHRGTINPQRVYWRRGVGDGPRPGHFSTWNFRFPVVPCQRSCGERSFATLFYKCQLRYSVGWQLVVPVVLHVTAEVRHH